MRRANDNGLLKNENGHVIAINLGADFTSEHEWGIKGLRALFGMKDKGMIKNLYGIERRTANEIPSMRNYRTGKVETCVHLIDNKTETVLLVGVEAPEKWDDKTRSRFELTRWGDNDLVSSWDERSFGVSGKTIESRTAIRDLYKAIQGGDFACWIGGGGVFQNGGLVLAMVSRLPAEKLKVMRDADLDREELEKTAEKTGIAAKLKAAGKSWFALSPSWIPENMVTENGPRKSSHKVMFWLNPMQQDIHNFGWFTVEELELWAENKGPCIGGRSAKKDRTA